MTETTPPIDTVRQIRDTCLCLTTQRAARILARRFDKAFAPVGITNGQFSVMVALSGHWRPKLKELAAFLAMDPTSLTALVKTLIRRGFVTLDADDGDARVRRPGLTPAGRAVVLAAVPIWKSEHAALDAEQGGTSALRAALRQLG